MTIQDYRDIYQYAKDDGVYLKRLSGNVEENAEILIQRINEKARKKDKYAMYMDAQYILDYQRA